ncbi:hypothetical protein GCM10010530_06600 [Kribbella aluminosa]
MADADHVRAGQRVAGHRLDQCTGNTKRPADQRTKNDPRDPQLVDDEVVLPAAAADGPPHLTRCEDRLTDTGRNSHDGQQQQDKNTSNNSRPPMQQERELWPRPEYDGPSR